MAIITTVIMSWSKMVTVVKTVITVNTVMVTTMKPLIEIKRVSKDFRTFLD